MRADGESEEIAPTLLQEQLQEYRRVCMHKPLPELGL